MKISKNESFEATVRSMAALQSANGTHPWWAVAGAVQWLLEVDDATIKRMVIEPMEREYNRIVGIDEIDTGAGTEPDRPGEGKPPRRTRAPRNTAAAQAGTRRTQRKAA